MMESRVVIVGAGFAGAVCARILAEHSFQVTILEKRSHIAGNMYDYKNEYGIIIHRYGPHILVLNDDKVFSFLSRFTEWKKYEHHVCALVDDLEIPLPINYNSLSMMFPEDFSEIQAALFQKYSECESIPILELLQTDHPRLKHVAEIIYRKIFVDYTSKMWGKNPKEIDSSVTARIPVRLSYDNRHFLHKYQFMPNNGYTCMFHEILSHPNIEIRLNTDAAKCLAFREKSGEIEFHGEKLDGIVIYTGPLDELFQYRFGALKYRSLRFEIETVQKDSVQDVPVLNWPDSRPATRRTEMKKLTQQIIPGVTTTLSEYPGAYTRESKDFSEPYYPLMDLENKKIYEKYKGLSKKIRGFYAVGRLAEYKYYNMELAIQAAMSTCERILN